MIDYDWLIIGGGLHGSFVARRILDAAPGIDLAVLDPAGPLDAWRRRANACGMSYLRSSNAHHLGRRADALRRFARARGFDATHELGYYRRPSRALFEAQSAEALTGLPRIRDRAIAIEDAARGWRVHTGCNAVLHARRVAFAPGPNAPLRPVWARDAEHVYDADFALERAGTGERLAVVGGGISGAQLALRAAAYGYCVHWITRDTPRRADFDSDPCYAGPRCLSPFARTPIAARTALLEQARQPGTLPPDVYARITAALAAGELGWQRGHVRAVNDDGLQFEPGRRLTADRVILAAGFEARPRNNLLADCITRLALATDHDGHVFVNDALEAAPGLHLLGRAASLQLGPMAGNIKGARLAGKRLAAIAGRYARQVA